MGDEFTTSDIPSLRSDSKARRSSLKVVIIKDGAYVYSTAPNTDTVDFSWRDNPPRSKINYYYVRGEQDNGEIVWASPMWINYTGR